MARVEGQLRQAFALLGAALEGLEAAGDEAAAGALAAAAAPLFAACAKLASAGALCCGVVLGDEGARRCGAKTAAHLVAQVSGTSPSAARRQLQVVDDLEVAPRARQAFRAGELSVDQAAALAPVLRLDPTQAGALLALAPTVSLSVLQEQAARTKAQLVGEAALQARARHLHARRYCRLTPVEGGLRLDALVGAHDAGALRAALGHETRRLWRQSAGDDPAASFDQLRADALVSLVTGARTTKGVVPHVLVHIDAAALRRGDLGAGERCEIQGVGPVPVATARELLGEGFFTLLVHDGADITTVTSMTRTISRRLRTALVARDPHCVVPGCEASECLEIDHWRTEFKDFGPTELDNLCRLCSRHHRMKTRTGWRIAGGPGKWQWLPPHRSSDPRALRRGSRATGSRAAGNRGAGSAPARRHGLSPTDGGGARAGP